MRRLVLTTALVLALLGAAFARGEVVPDGDLLVGFDARFAPQSLPRDRAVPLQVNLTGSVKMVDGSRPPQLRRISIALNRHGVIITRGLPTCSRAELESTSSTTALDRCRGALVGRGDFGANVSISGQDPVPIEGRVLAFNSGAQGRAAILVHIYASSPVRASVVLTFKISHRRQGEFGTVISTKIPTIASDFGYVTDVSLAFGRKYKAGGEQLSFLSARCAAPAGFPGAIFPFAKGRFVFANGQRVTSTVIRDCRVR